MMRWNESRRTRDAVFENAERFIGEFDHFAAAVAAEHSVVSGLSRERAEKVISRTGMPVYETPFLERTKHAIDRHQIHGALMTGHSLVDIPMGKRFLCSGKNRKYIAPLLRIAQAGGSEYGSRIVRHAAQPTGSILYMQIFCMLNGKNTENECIWRKRPSLL